MDSLFLSEYRCPCGKLLMKGIFLDGSLEIKCKYCKTLNKIGKIKLKNDKNNYSIIINNDGLVVNACDSACKILGYDYDELIGKKFTTINPTLPEEIGKKFFGPNSILNEDNYFNIYTNHKTKSGELIPILSYLKLYEQDKNKRYVLLSAEIKKPNSDYNLHDKQYIKNACDFYFEIDKDGMFTHIDSTMSEIFKLTIENVMGKPYFDILPKIRYPMNLLISLKIGVKYAS